MRILGIAQKGTESGLTRIRDLVSPDIDFAYLPRFNKSSWTDDTLKKYEPYDGILSQCLTHVPAEFREKSVLFSLGSCNRRILHKASVRDYMRKHPFRDFWVNNQTAADALTMIGFTPAVMYRANDILVPPEPLPPPKARHILWYCNPWNGCLQDHKELSKKVMYELAEHHDVRIFQLPHDKGWGANHHNIISLGKISLSDILPMVHGMVRLGILGDFGRINYDIVAAGKWCLNYNVSDPWMESISPDSSVVDIVNQILKLIDEDSEENRVDRWMYSRKHFTTKAMKKNWTEKLYYAFG
jgi:hypothetical protein